MTILFIGDIVGKSGREYISQNLRKIKNQYNVDICIANAENSAHGKGATVSTARELFESGVDILTMGNHTYNRNTVDLFDEIPYIIRPANYPAHMPGNGSYILDNGKERIGVINLLGRIYLEPIDSPFDAAIREIEKISRKCDAIIVDFHAEATSEKAAMAHFLDGKVAAVLGTHTHVQTADEKILSKGTAFISDVGMTGPKDSILGVKTEIIVERFSRYGQNKFDISESPSQFNGVVLEIDTKSGKSISIERVNL